MNGIINVYKPSGITSHDVVHKIRKLSGIKRVGHAGTLDPMATGVLPILVGNACSAQDYIMEHTKTYVAGIRFGIVTDTGDITGNILKTSAMIPVSEKIINVGESFIGEMLQLPPMYSAVKFQGKKLYEYAREGKNIERNARKITVYSSKMLSTDGKADYYFEFSVSKGTYIRTLAEDIGNKLECGATLFSLERTVCGEFNSENSHTLEEIFDNYERIGIDSLQKIMLPTENSFLNFPIIKLPKFYAKLCKNGLEIYLSKLGILNMNVGETVRLYDAENNFFAIGKIGEYSNGVAVKAVIRFDTERK